MRKIMQLFTVLAFVASLMAFAPKETEAASYKRMESVVASYEEVWRSGFPTTKTNENYKYKTIFYNNGYSTTKKRTKITTLTDARMGIDRIKVTYVYKTY